MSNSTSWPPAEHSPSVGPTSAEAASDRAWEARGWTVRREGRTVRRDLPSDLVGEYARLCLEPPDDEIDS